MREINIRMDTGGPPDGNQKLCPYCGFDYVHLERIEELHPTDDCSAYRVTTKHDGNTVSVAASVTPIKTSFRGRGVCLTYSCEEGHVWTEIQGFHKGFLFVDVQRQPDRETPVITKV